MSLIAVLGFYPVAAVSLAVALTALRLGRSVGRGLMLLCACLALWVIGLVLAVTPQTAEWAGRLLPCGMLLAGGFVHAFVEVAKLDARRWVVASWSFGAAVALFGALAPAAIYDPATNLAGPAFLPIGVVALIATIAVNAWMLRHVLAARGADRRKRAVLLGANITGSLGGGGIIVLRILDLGPMALASPLLLVSVLLASYAVLSEETGRHRELLVQGLWYALVTALLSAVGLTGFYFLLPSLLPQSGWAWVAWVTFLAALPLDPFRQLLIDQFSRVFERPHAVPALTRELEQSEARADHAEQLAALGRVASVVAHEIRNPLSVILAQARMLEREGASAERMKDVRDQVQRANRFVDELLQYSKPRPLKSSVVELATTCAEAMRNVEQAQGAKGLSLEPAPGVTVEADPQAVLDTATILLSNAAIAVEAVAQPKVLVRITDAGEMVAMSVEDNGPGVPAELEAKLFQMFVTGRGRDHKHPGIGLGLAVAAQHVQRHGGSIRHERAASGGARFVVSWPKRGRA